MVKNHEIRFNCPKEFKEEVVLAGKKFLGLNQQDTFQSLMEFALFQLRLKLSDPLIFVKVELNIPLNTKHIHFEKEVKK